MAAKIPQRLAPLARTRTLQLARVLGGDALSHPFRFTWSPRWSSDGSRVAVLGTREDRAAIAEFDASDGQMARLIEDVPSTTRAFALSPDGQTALLLDGPGATMLSLSDRTTQSLSALSDPYSVTNVCGFAPDGSYAIYSRHEDTLCFARRSTAGRWSGERIDGAQSAFAISADGARFAFARADEHVVIARASDGSHERTLPVAGARVEALRFGSSGTLLVALRDGALLCFDPDASAARWTRKQPRRVRAIGVDEASDRAWISVESSRELVIDLRTGAEIENRRLKVEPDCRAPDVYSSDGRRAFSFWYNAFALIDCRTGLAADLHDGHSGAITGIAVASDLSQFATSSADGTVRTWRAHDGALLWVLGEPESRTPIGAARYRDDGSRLLTYGFYNDVRVWDPVTGVELDRPARPYAEARNAPVDYPHTFSISWLSPVVNSEDYVLSGPASSSDYSSPNASWRIVRYDPSTGKVRWKHSDNTSRDSRFALSTDGRLLVQRERYGALRMFSMEDGALQSAPACESNSVSAMAFAPSGALIVCDADGVWWHEDAFAAPERRSADVVQGPLAIDPSGAVMACCASSALVRVLSLADGATLDEVDLSVAQDECAALAWVHDGRTLAVATKRNLVLLFSPAP
ncbi:MAG: WD40 repeat domain-containing protein [Polyangiales bacterium]